MVRVLIFDGHAATRSDLRLRLAQHGGVLVAGEAATPDIAHTLLARIEHELVFIDVLFAGAATFDLLAEMHPRARTIFLALNGDNALRAFDANALDYLLKPVQSPRLALALARLPSPEPPPIGPARRLNLTDTVRLNLDKTTRLVALGDVSVIQAQQNYSRIHLAQGRRLLVRQTLKSWTDALPPAFVQVHRGTVVNLERVVGFERTPRALALQLAGCSAPVTVSRLSAREVKARLHSRFPRL